MHYHPIPQMPGDFWILCEDHVSDDPEAYLCDCPNNRCYRCEEEDTERTDTPTSEEWLATLKAYCEKHRIPEPVVIRMCSVCGCDPSEHNWEVHYAEMRTNA